MLRSHDLLSIIFGLFFFLPLAKAEPIGPGARLFVTKCYRARDKMSENDFQQLANAGFTVAVDRWADDFPTYCQRAGQAGLDAMNIWRGCMPDANGANRVVTRRGKSTVYGRPTSKVGWENVTNYVVKQAQLSLVLTNYKGVIFDLEIYDNNKTDGFCESYDDESFREFFQSMKSPVPSAWISPDKRWEYLKNQGLLGLYIDYQYKQVAAAAKSLRNKVDAVNPEFQIGVYGWGVLVGAIMENVATRKAPVLDLNAVAYGRTIYDTAFSGGSNGKEPDRRGLKWSLISVAGLSREANKRNYPVVLLGGHWPQAPGPVNGTSTEQYKFTVRQSFNSAAYADGYWIWTNVVPPGGLDSNTWIDNMMAYWKEANMALDRGDFMWSSRQPDQVSDPNATEPMLIVTSNGQKSFVWNPISGEKIKTVDGSIGKICQISTNVTFDNKRLRVNGHKVELIDSKTNFVEKRFPAGHGTCGCAVGDVDGIAGPEIITLNAGWIKFWDPDSETELLRFYVGGDQKFIGICTSETKI